MEVAFANYKTQSFQTLPYFVEVTTCEEASEWQAFCYYEGNYQGPPIDAGQLYGNDGSNYILVVNSLAHESL